MIHRNSVTKQRNKRGFSKGAFVTTFVTPKQRNKPCDALCENARKVRPHRVTNLLQPFVTTPPNCPGHKAHTAVRVGAFCDSRKKQSPRKAKKATEKEKVMTQTIKEMQEEKMRDVTEAGLRRETKKLEDKAVWLHWTINNSERIAGFLKNLRDETATIEDAKFLTNLKTHFSSFDEMTDIMTKIFPYQFEVGAYAGSLHLHTEGRDIEKGRHEWSCILGALHATNILDDYEFDDFEGIYVAVTEERLPCVAWINDQEGYQTAWETSEPMREYKPVEPTPQEAAYLAHYFADEVIHIGTTTIARKDPALDLTHQLAVASAIEKEYDGRLTIFIHKTKIYVHPNEARRIAQALDPRIEIGRIGRNETQQVSLIA